MQDDVVVPIDRDEDVVRARAETRSLGGDLGFSRTDATLMATAVSEIARNVLTHASRGEIRLRPIREDLRFGLRVIARDSGPGIRDVSRVVDPHYASRDGLGLGLSGARRLMDDFEVESKRGYGTTVTMTKWRKRDDLERMRERRLHAQSTPLE
jgi:anti-sigma regulatory factor (Ser/Thr protein kinase)